DVVETTPGSLWNGRSMHQKHPPANVATTLPGGMAADCVCATATKPQKIAANVIHSMRSRDFRIKLSTDDFKRPGRRVIGRVRDCAPYAGRGQVCGAAERRATSA